MQFLKIIVFILIGIALTSFFYKIYLQIIITAPEKKASFFSIFLRFYGIPDFLPLSMKSHDVKENRTRRKANIALMIFYLSFILIILVSLTAS